MLMNECIFCKIIKGEIPSSKVYEDDFCFAFLDIKPINKGHVLVVPKEHTRNLLDAKDSVLKKLFPVIKKLANAVKTSLNADGINIGINNEEASGQAVMHFHIHIIPRFNNDGLQNWPGKQFSNEEMKEFQSKITAALQF